MTQLPKSSHPRPRTHQDISPLDAGVVIYFLRFLALDNINGFDGVDWHGSVVTLLLRSVPEYTLLIVRPPSLPRGEPLCLEMHSSGGSSKSQCFA
ncbi:hypothetical protein PAXRUDRAFT_834279 [Paxillus rubicundulus Ve08.2h10]|uniref:Uncharacterized protein n=1 Tax=Paxillus rubicundulus Ve08.2h10 TaxID=930991 RepID=A0A0D0DE37_9AGAM|nr:hypothetical protein PAXRUDRAFT_834279 [Paxillus rubicundulus Ve08.2h10]